MWAGCSGRKRIQFGRCPTMQSETADLPHEMKDKDHIEIKKAEKPYTAAFTLELRVALVADPQTLGNFEFAHMREAIVASP